MIACFFSYSFTFVVSASGREGCVLLWVFLLLFFSRRKSYFILHVGRVMDLSSAGQSLRYVSILEACISFEGRLQGSVCK